MSDSTFSTRNREVAAFIHFCRPDLLIAVTKVNERTATLEFADGKACAELQAAYFASAGVDDAKGLLESARQLKSFAYAAMNHPSGVWVRGDL